MSLAIGIRQTLLCLACLVATQVTWANEPPSERHAPPSERHAPSRPLTAAEVRDAPLPHQASGYLRPEAVRIYALVLVPRVLLLPVRLAFELAFMPLRGGLYVYEKYEIRDWLESFFFTEDRRFGVYPLAFFEAGFGFNVGGRVVVRDIFHRGESLRLRASYGGRFEQLYAGKLSSGHWLGSDRKVELRVEYEIFANSRFYGFGNADEVDPESVTMTIDPRTDSTAVHTRFRHDDFTVELDGTVALPYRLFVRPRVAYTVRGFSDDADDLDDHPLITDVYAVDALTGLGGLENLYTEIELSLDTRRATREILTRVIPSTGWYLAAFAGYTVGFFDDPSRYLRYGADLQRFFDLYAGDRILMLRLYTEAVSGGFDDVPFLDLPQLGGPTLLRGYVRGRFRDRVAFVGAAEYTYPIARQFAGYFFVDIGRVFRSYEDFQFRNYRIGFGGGLHFFTLSSYWASVALASSIDGGIYFNLAFDPAYEVRARRESR